MREHVFVRPTEQRQRVSELVAAGLNDCEISRRTSVPRSTVRGWRHGRRKTPVPVRSCASCGAAEHRFDELPARSYAYLLGQYLGDGHIAASRRGGHRLRISVDLLHLNVAQTCRWAIEDVLPGAHVALVCPPSARVVVVSSYSKQWPCLFPQHGPGRKHDRSIRLAGWQQALVDEHPDQIVRGLLLSDGWRGTNRMVVRGKAYAYPRYQFSQVSTDIQRIFTDALDELGVHWREMGPRNISIARKADVSTLDGFIERKS